MRKYAFSASMSVNVINDLQISQPCTTPRCRAALLSVREELHRFVPKKIFKRRIFRSVILSVSCNSDLNTERRLASQINKKLSYRRDSARCRNGHPMSLKVIRCCANWRGIHDFLLALNSNLTFIFNRSWDITPSLHLSIPHLSSTWNWKKDPWE